MDNAAMTRPPPTDGAPPAPAGTMVAPVARPGDVPGLAELRSATQ